MPDDSMANPRCLRRALTLAIFLAATVVGGGEAPCEEAGREATMVLVTRADAGKVVEARVSEDIAVVLDENPTTGFAWAIEAMDSTVLALKGSDFTPAAGGGLGAGGRRTFTLQTRRAGVATLNFLLRRQWQGETAPPAERFTVTIRVE